MTGTLFAKEVRELAPLIAAIVLINLAALSEYFVFSSPDEFRWASVSFLLDQSLAEVTAASTILIAVFAAYLMYPREHDERTIEFLHSLPVGRLRVFAVKYLCASLTLIVLFTVTWVPLLWALHLFDPNSITSGQFRWDFLLVESCMEAAVVLMAVAHGMLIAYFRMFGVLGAIIGWLSLSTLAVEFPGLGSLDPSSLYRVEFDGTDVIVPWARWGGHGLAAGCSLAAAAFLWTRAGERRSGLLDRIVRSAAYRTATTATATLAVVLMATAVVIGSRSTLEAVGGEDEEPEVEVMSTPWLEFRYLLAHEAAVTALADEAEGRYASVRAMLGAAEPARIVVDLTQPGVDHLGLASWKRLRMDISSIVDDWPLALHVFDHEIAHVVAAARSAGRLSEHRLDGGIVFNEGLADWIAFEMGERADARAGQRRLARAAWARLDLEVADLFDTARLLERYDEYLVYPLGESWVDALAESCGVDAPARVLDSMARPDAPRQLVGEAYWRDTLQAGGCDLDAVNARFETALATGARDEQPPPRVTGTVRVPRAGEAVFAVRLRDAAPERRYTVWVRVRDGPRTPSWQIAARRTEVLAGEPASVVMDLDSVSGDRFEYQLGVELEPGARPLFSRWTKASTRPDP